jgi:hypothetical protein
MSRNSQHGKKLNKRWDAMELRNRQRQGKQTAAPVLDPHLGRIGEILEAPDPRTFASLRRLSQSAVPTNAPAEHCVPHFTLSDAHRS